ncbi:MAG TPA: tetratricopeptide repeat-containing sensor histidine kinase [Chryseolinea sp.]|nr:tetratricopeptide repeat-containing sensor histidine kinase [Chryseolinea sp.]
MRRKTWRLSFLVLLLFATIIRGYGQSIDSLEHALKTTLSAADRIIISNKIAFYYLDVDLERSEKFSMDAVGLIEMVNDKNIIARTLSVRGSVLEAQGKYIPSLDYQFESLALVEETKNLTQISACNNNIGIVYNQLGEFALAAEYLLKAVAIDEKINDISGLGSDYINLAAAYMGAKNYEMALYYSHRSLHNFVAIQDEFLQAYSAESLGSIFIKTKNVDSAYFYIKKSVALARKAKISYIEDLDLMHLGEIHVMQERYDSARIFFNSCIERNEQNPHSEVMLNATTALAQCLFLEKKYAAALAMGDKAYQLCKAINNKPLTLKNCELMANIYQKQNQTAKAFTYLRLASLYKDSIMDQTISGSLDAKAFNARLERERLEKQSLQKDKESIASILLESNRQLTGHRLVNVLITIVALSLLAVVFLVRRSSLARRKANEELQQKNKELHELNTEINGLVHTIIHDLKSPFNSIQGIFTLLEFEKDKSESTTTLIQHGRKALSFGNDIIHQLLEVRELEERSVKQSQESIDLPKLLHELKDEFELLAKSKEINLIVSAGEGNVFTDKILVKRILQNLTSNALKFSPAQKVVTLKAQCDGTQVTFEVIDQGPGFTEMDRQKIYGKFQKLSARPTGGESSNGLGLATVSMLVKKLQGSIELNSTPGEGAAFIVRIPL